ncbi:uncharacterized protein LOC120423089 [Culex pipiens pallens]|uniref:uncharacterized protein LOC120423089 n=1 Tax=Culex pipiens pallens TaxID=42434 RepID=UPI0019545C4B|nr:uncharacterized protein LOC120423089 [Culex pipiens pallens]
MTSFLHVRRPTTYSKLEQSIPKPPEACPAFGGLPQWEKLPLDRRLPANACPVHPPAFRRGKLSEHLWDKPHDLREFDLSDPLGHDVSYGYMALHDKHLRGHFEVDAFKDEIVEKELVDDRDDVVCSLLEFNRFRFYLWKLHRNRIKKEFQKLDRTWWQQYRNHVAALHIQRHYDFEGKHERIRCHGRALREAKKQKAVQSIAKYNRQLQQFWEAKGKDRRMTLYDGFLRALQVKHNNALLRASRKSYCLRLRRKLREKDQYRTKRMAILKKRTLESKRIMTKERHKMLFISAQQAEEEREHQLEIFLHENQRNVERRMLKSMAQQEQFERQLTQRKARNLASRYNKRSKSAMINAMLKAWNSIRVRQPHLSHGLSQASVRHAVDFAYNIHETISPTISSTQIIDTAKQYIHDLTTMPSEQLPLDRQTVRYTGKALLEIMDQIKAHTVDANCLFIGQIAVNMRERILAEQRQQRMSVLCGPWSVKWRRSSMHSPTGSHRVSIGEVEIVDEYQTEQETFKRTRNRPPTPVTSATSLVEHFVGSSADDSIVDLTESSEELVIPSTIAARTERLISAEDHPLVHLTQRQKRFLETNLLKYRAIVQRNVETRTRAAIDVLRLEIDRQRARRPKRGRECLAKETARCILMFPKQDEKYAELLLEAMNTLFWEVCDEIEARDCTMRRV